MKADLHLAQGLLLTTYMKLLVADPGDTALHELVDAVFERYARCGVGVQIPVLSTLPCCLVIARHKAGVLLRFMDADLQQRAAEYLALGRRPDVAARNITAMPPWEKRKSLLLRRMAEREARRSCHLCARPATAFSSAWKPAVLMGCT